jgi:hypothetical protein
MLIIKKSGLFSEKFGLPKKLKKGLKINWRAAVWPWLLHDNVF